MSTTKITSLPVLTTPSANGANTVFVVVDKSSGTPTTKQINLSNLDSFVDNIGPVAFVQANSAFDKANASGVVAQAGFDKANSANVVAQAGFDQANTANTTATSALTTAQAAYNTANTANTTDYTTISTTAGVYGNATHVAVVTLAANGRVSSITNTAITGFANATFAQAAFDAANTETIGTAAFAKANSANVLAQAAYDTANSLGGSFNSAAYDQANAAFDQANTASNTATGSFTHANSAFDKANSANVIAQSSYNFANTVNTTLYLTISNTTNALTLATTANTTATSGYTHANGAFDKANSANVLAQAAYNQANTGTTLAQNAYNYANTLAITVNDAYIANSYATANGAFLHANGAFDRGNTALTTAALSFNTANTADSRSVQAFGHANGAFDKANSANVLAQAAFNQANIATPAFAQANAAYTQANIATPAFAQANAATTLAQAAYDQANTASVINTQSQAAYDQANTASNTALGAFTHANSAYDIANTALATAAIAINYDNQANAAYDIANSSLTLAQNAYNASNTANAWSNTVVLVTAQAAFDRSNTNLTSIEIGLYPKLNSAYDQANTANGRAFTSVQKGGDTMTGPLTITTNAIIGFTVTSNTSNTVGGATNPVVEMTGKANNYIQTYLFNETNEKYSSADFVAYPHNGNDANGWIDMGITSLSFDYPTFSITGGNEGYIFMSAPNGSGTSGNLVIATDSTGTDNAIEFYVGGFDQTKANAKLTIKDTELLVGTNLVLLPDNAEIVSSLGSVSIGNYDISLSSTIGAYSNYYNTSANNAFVELCARDGNFNQNKINILSDPDSNSQYVSINTYDGGALYGTKEWNFYQSGKTKFPSVTAPASSIGATGDVQGMVAFTSSYIYYCSANYDGSTNIWKRLAWSGDTW